MFALWGLALTPPFLLSSCLLCIGRVVTDFFFYSVELHTEEFALILRSNVAPLNSVGAEFRGLCSLNECIFHYEMAIYLWRQGQTS